MKKEPRYMTAQDFAERIDRPYSTIVYWLKAGKVPGVVKLTIGNVRFWQIPETAVKDFKIPSRGRPKGSKNKKSKLKGNNHV